MKIISLHEGATSSEMMEPQFAIAVSMTDAECEALVNALNNALESAGANMYETCVTWFKTSPLNVPLSTDPAAPSGTANTQDFIDAFVTKWQELND